MVRSSFSYEFFVFSSKGMPKNYVKRAIPRSAATRNLLFPGLFRKSRSLAALGMTSLRLQAAT